MRSTELVRGKKRDSRRDTDVEPGRTTGSQREGLGSHYGAGPASRLEGVETVRDEGAEEMSGGVPGRAEEPVEGGDVEYMDSDSARTGGEEASGGAAEGGTDSELSKPDEAEAGSDGGRSDAQSSGSPSGRKKRSASTAALAGTADSAPAREADESATERDEPSAGGSKAELPTPAASEEVPSGARFRVPKSADLQSTFDSTTLKIPPDVIKDRVGKLLARIEKEAPLPHGKTVAEILGEVFPSGGGIKVAALEKYFTPGDLNWVYGSVKKANTKVDTADKSKLEKGIEDAAVMAETAAADADNLKRVFGGKKSKAKTIYTNTAKRLRKISTKMDKKITTDYNRDDEEVGLGGWADFSSQEMHLDLDTVKVKDIEAKFTILHEGAHLANASVDDYVYYPNAHEDAFKANQENVKIKNAAHFEEIPRRHNSASVYADTEEFKPGVTSTGGSLTFDEKVVEEVEDYLRKAWDKAVDVFAYLRKIRKKLLDGKASYFKNRAGKAKAISKLMELTIHEQERGSRTVTQLDVVLAESIAGRLSSLKDKAGSVTVPAPPSKMTSKEEKKLIKKLGKELALEIVKTHGGLLDDDAKNEALLKWLVLTYRKAI